MSEVKRFDHVNHAHVDDCAHIENPGGAWVKASDYDALAAEAQALREEVAAAQKNLAFTEQWFAVRHERLWHWAHEELSEEQKRRYFNIVANGTAEHNEPPIYAQQICRMKHRAESAEQELAALRARAVVVPERKLLNAGVPGLNRNSGWNACLDELARLNGKTVSEGLLRLTLEFIMATNYKGSIPLGLIEELRALLNQDKENGNG
ncbi:TPA: hypothetical protein L5682_002037 [Pseudomonas aeruginosa]|nr:hypothetical protein [Pseudomonas aeruginosa]